MTVPSEKTLTIAKCPNCECKEWAERTVDWISGAPKEVNPESYLEIRARASGAMRPTFMICDEYIQKVRQFILICKRCGYTLIKDYEEKKPEKEETKIGRG